MQFKYLDKLKNEFKRFTGFTIQDKIKNPSSKAVAYLSNDSICLPIEEKNCPVVKAFAKVSKNKKASRHLMPLISAMCLCLRSEVFTGDSLQEIIKTFESLSPYVDYDSGIIIIQFASTYVGDKFFDFPTLKCILSLTFSLIPSPVESLQTASLAAISQIISSFIKFTLESPTQTNDTDKCIVQNGAKPLEFKNSFYKITYLILRDISRMCNNNPPLWINNHNIKPYHAFGIMENIIQQFPSFFKESDNFMQLISDSLSASRNYSSPISFSILCMDTFLETIPDNCKSHFSYFLSQLKTIKGESNLDSLLFFRTLLLKRSSFIYRFFKNCDSDSRLFESLIQILRKINDKHSKKNNITLSLKPKIPDEKSSDLLYSAPIEISVCFIRECYNSISCPNIKILVNSIWSDILSIISTSMCTVHINSCYVLLQNLHLLINLSYELKIDEVRGASISAFCTTLLSEQEEIKRLSYDTISYAIQSSPEQFIGFWYRIFSSLAEFQWTPTSFEFVSNTSTENIIEMSIALISSQDGDKSTLSWSLTLLSDLLISNKERFNDIWGSIKEKYYKIFDYDFDIALNSFNHFAIKGFCKENEELICSIINELIIQFKESRNTLLETIRLLLIQNSTDFVNGWDSICKILSPINFNDDIENMNQSFSCFQNICNNLLFTLDKSIQCECIKLVFEFSKQNVETNISLSSFELIWNIVTIIKTSDLWLLIFNCFLNSFIDQRVDVSTCSIKTFFALIMSNISSLPNDIVEYLGKEFFFKIFDKLYETPNDLILQLTFNEISHCGCTLWNYFSNYKEFTNDLWSKLIELHSVFIRSCKIREIKVNSFLFYEELFQCFELKDHFYDKLFKSLEDLSDYLLENENPRSVLFSTFGRLILVVLPIQKPIINKDILDKWIHIIGKLILEIKCDNFLPPTTHKTLDALLQLLPLSNELTFDIYSFIVSLVIKSKNVRLIEVAIDRLTEICNKVNSELYSKLFILSNKLFNINEAENLLIFFLDNDFDILNSEIENVFDLLIELTEVKPNLTLKAGKKVLKLFPHLNDQQKLIFVEKFKNSYETETELWRIYLDPTSDKFDENSAMICTKEIVKSVGKKLSESLTDDELAKELTFLRDIKTYPKAFGERKEGNYCHVLFLCQYFADLILHPNTEIKKIIREIFLKIEDAN